MQAHHDLGHFHGQTEGELKAWFKQILLHNIIDLERQYLQAHKRQLRVEVPLVLLDKEPPAPTLSPPAQALEREKMELFRQALEALDERDREMICLRIRDDLRFDQIGALMGFSEGAARSLWYRVIERLASKSRALRDDQ